MGVYPVSCSWQTGSTIYRPLVVPAQEGAFLPERMIVSSKYVIFILVGCQGYLNPMVSRNK